MKLSPELIDENHEPFKFVRGVIHKRINLLAPKVLKIFRTSIINHYSSSEIFPKGVISGWEIQKSVVTDSIFASLLYLCGVHGAHLFMSAYSKNESKITGSWKFE
jgi:hypothetical protein